MIEGMNKAFILPEVYIFPVFQAIIGFGPVLKGIRTELNWLMELIETTLLIYN